MAQYQEFSTVALALFASLSCLDPVIEARYLISAVTRLIAETRTERLCHSTVDIPS